MEMLTITHIDCPELPEGERWRVARGEHTVATFAHREDAERFREAVLRARFERWQQMTTIDNPLVAGGQGRSAQDIEDGGAAMGIAIALAFSLAAWAAVAWLCGFFN